MQQEKNNYYICSKNVIPHLGDIEYCYVRHYAYGIGYAAGITNNIITKELPDETLTYLTLKGESIKNCRKDSLTNFLIIMLGDEPHADSLRE